MHTHAEPVQVDRAGTGPAGTGEFLGSGMPL